MKRIPINYGGFHICRINEPRFSHLKLLFSWPCYFALLYLTETCIPAENCYSVHCFLDDLIPFCEYFILPYIFWYFLVFFTLLYFLRYNADSFRKLQTYLIITQMTAMVCYILFPTRQDLRPQPLPRNNGFAQAVAFLYSIDTNTGVCPSLHVAFSLAVGSAWWKEKDFSIIWKVFILVWVILICLSTMFIKQHSALDFFAAIPICLFAEWFVYVRKKPGTAA